MNAQKVKTLTSSREQFFKYYLVVEVHRTIQTNKIFYWIPTLSLQSKLFLTSYSVVLLSKFTHGVVCRSSNTTYKLSVVTQVHYFTRTYKSAVSAQKSWWFLDWEWSILVRKKIIVSEKQYGGIWVILLVGQQYRVGYCQLCFFITPKLQKPIPQNLQVFHSTLKNISKDTFWPYQYGF